MKRISTRLTSKETARLLGVSEASIKRWADGGLLPMEKTAGGHRRFRPEDVAAFRHKNLHRANRTNGSASAEASAAPADAAHETVDEETLAQAMFEALTGGGPEAAAGLLVSLHLRGYGVAAAADTVLCPSLRRVGELWYCGGLSIAQEHAATRAALFAVETLRSTLAEPARAGPVALCCAVEEDFHELPVQLAALVLRGAGWEVFNLGPHTPFFSLTEAVARYEPRLVCVSATVFAGMDRAAREYKDFTAAAARAGASVVLGGQGFAGSEVRARFPAESHAESFRELEAIASRLAAGQKEAG